MTKILVVDDEPAIVVYLTTVLGDEGYDTCSTTEALAVLDLVRAERPDLICLDIMMPQRSGLSLYQSLKRDPETRAVPIVFVSAFSELHDLSSPVYFRKLIPEPEVPEPDACIEKPIDVPSFLETIARLVKSPASQGKP